MATPSQIHANRLNALKSTGPRSVEGKAATRFNTLKHGIDAGSLLVPGEDSAEFEELRAAYYEQFQPCGPVETALLDTIVRCDWNQRRYARIEAEVIRTLVAAMEPSDSAIGAAFHQDAAGANALQKLFRRQQAAQRDWRQAIAELHLLQEQRPPSTDPADPAPSISAPALSQSRDCQEAGPQPIPTKGGNWLGSEPLSWRL
jgi:hypothetical protein